MNAHSVSRWSISVAAMIGFTGLALGSGGPDLAETFDEVAKEVEAEERRRAAAENVRVDADVPEAPPEPGPPIETVEHGTASATVRSKSGSDLVMELEGTPPPPGATVTLGMLVMANEYGADVESEINMGAATVTDVTAEGVTLEITETSSAAEGFAAFDEYTTLVMTW